MTPRARAAPRAACAVLLAATLAACSGNRPPRDGPSAAGDGAASTSASAAASAERDGAAVGVRPGDALRVRVYGDSAVSGEFRVNENGRVVLPLVGDRHVEGLTPDSARAYLRAAYGQYLRDPVIDVTVLRRVSILGAVRQPGLYPVDPTVSLAEALATAGGVTGSADRDGIRLIRDGRVIREQLDRQTLLGQTPIQSGDRVYVTERSWFVRNWQWFAGTATSALFFAFLR